ncbi:hypothetical protein EDD66_105129 [Mobilisporobacter senegalensis]|uniref:Uncharacterized protein n=1 Tax=Mobilisporobacter senegalensis TaxID=1329262 RepID=A0A3N1XNB5_9FIRM|nr:hypothetical protein [Mobilisporobacter senegalensis]ROR28190.1 hypothetical protein EDD66_105129 [Mobilisporobacter senegalensis]
MESVLDLIYQTFIVVIFCFALSLLLLLYNSCNQTIDETKNVLYRQHGIMEN